MIPSSISDTELENDYEGTAVPLVIRVFPYVNLG